MAEPTEPQVPAEAPAPEPVAAAEHVGVDPVVPATAEPEVVEAELVEEAAPSQPAPPVMAPPVMASPVTAEPVAPAPDAAAAAAAAAQAAREVVYVQAPTPPAPRHNRGFGVLISLLGAVTFALLFIGVVAVMVTIAGASLDETLTQFLSSMAFWVPVAVYTVVSILFALIVNRAAWWAHVLGSLFVAALTYAISAGIILLALNVFAMTPEEGVQQVASVFGSPWLIVALVIARETALWFGLAISARGRRVKARNADARAAFDQSVADRRAEYERAHPSV